MKIHGSGNGCRACGHVFGTLTVFDRHQTADYTRSPAVACTAPEALGLVRDGFGTWQTPAGLIRRHRDRERLSQVGR